LTLRLFHSLGILAVFSSIVFLGGFLYGEHKMLTKLKPFLPRDVTVSSNYENVIGVDTADISPRNRNGKLETPAVSIAPLESQVSGNAVKLKAIPLIKDQEERSGWGNDFELKSVDAVETTVIDGKLLFKTTLEIENRRNTKIMADVSVSILDSDEKPLGSSDISRIVLMPLETRKVEDEILLKPSLKELVDSVVAKVKTVP